METKLSNGKHVLTENEWKPVSRATGMELIAIICCLGGCIFICRGYFIAVIWSAVWAAVMAIMFDRLERLLKRAKEKWESEDSCEAYKEVL